MGGPFDPPPPPPLERSRVNVNESFALDRQRGKLRFNLDDIDNLVVEERNYKPNVFKITSW